MTNDGSFTGTAQWRRIRREVLERDEYRCRVHGPHCKVDANEVDHIVPVADGGALFDRSNLRAACKDCNIWRANRQKSRDGWKRSRAHIVLVVGSVGSGKSTYVSEHAGPNDLVIDYDAISQAFGPAQSRGAKSGRHSIVNQVRGSVLSRIRRGEVDAETIWIVSANPEAERLFPYHEVVVVDPGQDQVLAQCGTSRPVSFVGLVDEWYARRTRTETARREW